MILLACAACGPSKEERERILARIAEARVDLAQALARQSAAPPRQRGGDVRDAQAITLEVEREAIEAADTAANAGDWALARKQLDLAIASQFLRKM